MLLQRLKELYERGLGDDEELPPLYSEVPVRYIVELGADGRLLNPRPTDTADPADPRAKRGLRRRVPQVKRSSGIKPLLLADKADYTLGVAKEGGDPTRAAGCHTAYLALLDRCVEETREPEVALVRRFLGANPREQLELGEDFDPTALITFRVGWQFPVDLPAVRRFWAGYNDPAGEGREATVMQCIVCGRETAVLPRLQANIKGVPGGQTGGTAIISANAEAFESYGLEASLIAPTCPACGEGFTRAANWLLSDRSSHYVLGNAAFVFWTRGDVGFSIRTYLDDPQPEQVRDLYETLHRGGLPAAVDATSFYAAALSASGGRTVVRDWLDTTVGQAMRRLDTWFARQAVVDEWGGPTRPLGLYALAAATVRDPAKELAPPTSRALLHAALTGSPLPLDLLYRAVRRNRAERDVNRQRAALIKLVLRSQPNTPEEDTMTGLNLANPDPAYRCGRLLAVLEEAQEAAIPGLRQTLVDRFYGAASAAPASVFGRLMHGARPHLSKLRRDRPGAYRAIQVRLEDIQAGMDGFPRVLALEEQALFALGYYHQRAHDRAERKAAAERKRAAGQSDENDTVNADEEE